jgi:hypothetical protein
MDQLGNLAAEINDIVDEDDIHTENENHPGGHMSLQAIHSRTISEISAMADKMSDLIQEIRNVTKENEERLRSMELDLQLLGLENTDG